MATRSIIARQKDREVESIYCHWDGYPTHVGAILDGYYTDQESVDKLMALGSLSSLEPKCDRPVGHSFDSPVDGYCVAYGRDRGEGDVEPELHQGLFQLRQRVDDAGAAFVYLFMEDEWHGAATDGKFAFEFFPIKKLIQMHKDEVL